MKIESNVPLQPYNTFGIAAKALQLVRVTQTEALPALLRDPVWHGQPKFVLGGGSNIVITGDVKPLVIKMENQGRRLLREDARHWWVEAEAGENWHDFVAWTLAQGWPGLENLALIPGHVGAWFQPHGLGRSGGHIEGAVSLGQKMAAPVGLCRFAAQSDQHRPNPAHIDGGF